MDNPLGSGWPGRKHRLNKGYLPENLVRSSGSFQTQGEYVECNVQVP